MAHIADDDAHLNDIFDLDNATNDRLRAENNLLPGIGIHELVFDVPYYRIVNAAFCHPHPLGSRFNGPDRGAWYAAFEIATAQAEVAFHKWIELAEVSWFDENVTYDDYLADFSAEFHDEVAGSAGGRYLIAPGYIRDLNNGGHICFVPENWRELPVADTMLARKIALENDEAGVLNVAFHG